MMMRSSDQSIGTLGNPEVAGLSSRKIWGRLSSDTLTMQAPKFVCLSPYLVPRGQPESQTRGLEARRLTLCLANPRLGSVNSLDPEMDPAIELG